MKVYLYCIETGVYQGEDFADKGFLKMEQPELPPGCTTIVPPAFAKGEVPVFEIDQHRWVVRPVLCNGGRQALRHAEGAK